MHFRLSSFAKISQQWVLLPLNILGPSLKKENFLLCACHWDENERLQDLCRNIWHKRGSEFYVANPLVTKNHSTQIHKSDCHQNCRRQITVETLFFLLSLFSSRLTLPAHLSCRKVTPTFLRLLLSLWK